MTVESAHIIETTTCPRCKSPPHYLCKGGRTNNGGRGIRCHKERIAAWRASLVGERSLRGLGEAILELARTHPTYGQAAGIIANCYDHLCLLDRYHSANKS